MITASALVNSPEWLAIHEHDHVYRLWITFPPDVSSGRDREYVFRVPNENAMKAIVRDFCRTPHTIAMYERIDG